MFRGKPWISISEMHWTCTRSNEQHLFSHIVFFHIWGLVLFFFFVLRCFLHARIAQQMANQTREFLAAKFSRNSENTLNNGESLLTTLLWYIRYLHFCLATLVICWRLFPRIGGSLVILRSPKLEATGKDLGHVKGNSPRPYIGAWFIW